MFRLSSMRNWLIWGLGQIFKKQQTIDYSITGPVEFNRSSNRLIQVSILDFFKIENLEIRFLKNRPTWQKMIDSLRKFQTFLTSIQSTQQIRRKSIAKHRYWKIDWHDWKRSVVECENCRNYQYNRLNRFRQNRS